MTQWQLRQLALVCAVALSGETAFAASKTVDMKLHIVINAPLPCTITGSEVEFGNVLITDIESGNYQQKVGYSLNCSGRVSDFLKLQIQGTAVNINGESVLQTSVADLGIRLQSATDSTIIPPGTTDWLPFQYRADSIPGIQAVLVKKNGVTLTGGEFNAAATLVVDYQ